ncbi:hypothetical protein B0T19DRAFT_238968 [Cercophora scortea]|uniref:Uncharacterized protein n=1 Tax=Cercophora scortea TaxID=314031 RepID=A0AAE0IH31_9PEZI|nr:hypothetical protein B0T19DRAFT_238968 [Cercophora scortea]
MALAYLHAQGIASTIPPSLVPRDSPSPTFPSEPVSQLTPPPGCGIGSDLWLVSKTCHLHPRDATDSASTVTNPSWFPCTAIVAGRPAGMDRYADGGCYAGQLAFTIGPDATTTQYSACPVGYTTASTKTFTYDYDREPGSRAPPVPRPDVVNEWAFCCPSGTPDMPLHFRYIDRDYEDTYLSPEFKVNHDGQIWVGSSAAVPQCLATRVDALARKQVTLTSFSDTLSWPVNWDKNFKRQAVTPSPALVTQAWEDDTWVWAEAESFGRVVYANGFTCYKPDVCADYYTNTYLVTASALPPRTTTTSTTAGADSRQVRGLTGVFLGLGMAVAVIRAV